MKHKLLTKLTELSKYRLALETDLLAYYEACGVKDLSNKTKQIVIEHSKKRIAYDNKVIALIEGDLLTKELYHELGAERIKMDDDIGTDVRAAGLSDGDWTTLSKTTAMFLEREQALDAKRREARAAFYEEYGE